MIQTDLYYNISFHQKAGDFMTTPCYGMFLQCLYISLVSWDHTPTIISLYILNITDESPSILTFTQDKLKSEESVHEYSVVWSNIYMYVLALMMSFARYLWTCLIYGF